MKQLSTWLFYEVKEYLDVTSTKDKSQKITVSFITVILLRAFAAECVTSRPYYRLTKILLQHEAEETLLQDLQNGKEAALDSLFRNHYTFLCQVVFRMIGDANLAEDLVQEVFYEVWRKRQKLNIQQTFRGYLKRAAVNRTLNYIRDQKLVVDDESAMPYDLATSEAGVVQQMEAEELQQHIKEAIGALPERCRVVFSLSRFEYLSNQKIAEELDISVKTVENQMTKALRFLREKLKPYIGVIILAIFIGNLAIVS